MTNEVVLVAGLGNPGKSYMKNRHNVGFWFVDMLAQKYAGKFVERSKLLGSICQIHLDEKPIYLFKPGVFMNHSGNALHAISRFYRIDTSQILIAHDEIDFPSAQIKLKSGGGHGGHNGLRDIIKHIGDNFWRLRIGIGHPGSKDQVTSYVLGNVTTSECEIITMALGKSAAIMPHLRAGEFDLAMNDLHC